MKSNVIDSMTIQQHITYSLNVKRELQSLDSNITMRLRNCCVKKEKVIRQLEMNNKKKKLSQFQ